MQRDREGREHSIHFDGFDSFGGFGPHRSMMSSIFEGRDPFDDPFFTRPSGSIFGSSIFGPTGMSFNSPQISSSKGPVIEELNTDDDDEEEEEDNNTRPWGRKEKTQKSTLSNSVPLVEHPEDQIDEKQIKSVSYKSGYNKVERTQPQTRSVSFQKVTYGGIDGAYFAATTSRKTGRDGVVLEESKQADMTTGQATHRISRGIHNKGHSLTRKLNSDGNVDTMQTLHNLNEDEVAGFEQSWKGTAEMHLPSLNDRFDSHESAGASSSGHDAARGKWGLPLTGFHRRAGGARPNNEGRTYSSGGRPKKVVTINIE